MKSRKYAIARELLCIVHFLLKTQEPYDAYHLMKLIVA